MEQTKVTFNLQEPVVGHKKRYQSPQLTEWGSIVDLTQGVAGGFDDFPVFGGTKGV